MNAEETGGLPRATCLDHESMDSWILIHTVTGTIKPLSFCVGCSSATRLSALSVSNEDMPVSEIHALLRSNCFAAVCDFVQNYPHKARSLNSARSTPLAVLVRWMTWGRVNTALTHNIPSAVEGFQDAFEAMLATCPDTHHCLLLRRLLFGRR